MSLELPETEGAMRGWLRGNVAIAAEVDDRTYFAMPVQEQPRDKFIILYRVGGAPDSHLQDYPDFILECWGPTKHAASNLAKTVATQIVLSEFRAPVVIGDVRVMMGSVNSGPVPNDGTSWAKRYRLDTTFHMRSV